MNEYETETELMDYLNVIWRRKWLIIIPAFFLVIAVVVISLLLPKQWEIDTIIQPSKFLIQTEGGQFNEIVVVDPKQLASQINEKSYDHLIASKLDLDIRKFHKLKADNLGDTNLVQVSLKERDVEKAKLILNSLFNLLKEQLDDKVEIETQEVESQIKSKEIEKLGTEDEIKAFKNKLIIIYNYFCPTYFEDIQCKSSKCSGQNLCIFLSGISVNSIN